jgi:hypothetical protein
MIRLGFRSFTPIALFCLLWIVVFHLIFCATLYKTENSSEAKRRTVYYKSEQCNCSRLIPVSEPEENAKFRETEFIVWCSVESFIRGYHRNVVSYALYGNAIDETDFELTRYFALLNILPMQVKRFYPGKHIIRMLNS